MSNHACVVCIQGVVFPQNRVVPLANSRRAYIQGKRLTAVLRLRTFSEAEYSLMQSGFIQGNPKITLRLVPAPPLFLLSFGGGIYGKLLTAAHAYCLI